MKNNKEQKELLKQAIRLVLNVDVERKTRKAEYVNARIIYANILMTKNHTQESIGDSVGLDHATIVHYKRAMSEWRAKDKEFIKMYNDVKVKFDKNDRTYLYLTKQDLEQSTYSLRNQNNLLTLELINVKSELSELRKKMERFSILKELVDERADKDRVDWTHYKMGLFFDALYL